MFHDDQHGTAIVVAAALLNAMRVTGKQMGQMKIVINGAGAAGIAIGKLLISMGFGNIVMCDINGIICEGMRGSTPDREISHISNRNHEHGALADALQGADAFVGVSRPNLVTAEMVSTMKDGIVFAMANPTPEIMPDEAKQGRRGGGGHRAQRFSQPDQQRHGLPRHLRRGALAVRAREITEGMKIRAARALAALVTDEQLSADYILPSALDKSVADTVAHAVAQEAKRAGHCTRLNTRFRRVEAEMETSVYFSDTKSGAKNGQWAGKPVFFIGR